MLLLLVVVAVVVVAAVPFPLVAPAVPSNSIPIGVITFSPLSPFPVSVSVSRLPFPVVRV